jgi:hypothetical protein
MRMDVHARKDSVSAGADEGPADIESALITKGTGSDDASTKEAEIPQEASYIMKVSSAMFYSGASLAVIFANKSIMTGYHFPFVGVMATVQFLGTSLVLMACQLAGRLELPPLTWKVTREIFPLSFMFLGNILSGLGGTRNLNLPMFTCLRRFSILMTMLSEWCFLGSKPNRSTQLSVFLMIGGSIIAALYDFTYDREGYALVMVNNVFTALNGVWMKRAIVSSSLKSNKLGVLFYNSLFSAIAMIFLYFVEHLLAQSHNASLIGSESIAMHNAAHGLVTSVGGHSLGVSEGLYAQFYGQGVQVGPGEGVLLWESTVTKVRAFEGWDRSYFLFFFFSASVLGSVLNYSIFLCTAYNSALTTAVIGCLKNVATAYLGMLLFSDFSYNLPNFIGINISIAGSIYYTYCELFRRSKAKGSS